VNVEDALRALESDGRLTPEAVFEAARDEASPLHAHFEWDATKAAYAHNIELARRLIRSVHVVVTREERTVSVVRYVRDPLAEKTTQGYVSLDKISGDPDSTRQMLAYEFARASACLNRAQAISDALGMKRAISAAVKKVDELQRKVAEPVRARPVRVERAREAQL